MHLPTAGRDFEGPREAVKLPVSIPRSPLASVTVTVTDRHNQRANSPISLTAKQSPGKFCGFLGVVQGVRDGDSRETQVTENFGNDCPVVFLAQNQTSSPGSNKSSSRA